MNPWIQRSLACLVAACLWASAHAAQADAQTDTVHARERAAKAAFDAGVAAAEAGDYASARDLFLRSRQLVVKASTLLNLAVADLKLGLVDEALFALDALDAPAVGPEHGRLRERARSLRLEAEGLRSAAAAEEARQLESPDDASTGDVRVEPTPERNPAPGDKRAALAPEVHEPTAIAPTPAPDLVGPRALLIVGGALAGAALGGALWWADRSDAVDKCRPASGEECLQRAQLARQETAAMGMTLTLGVSAVAALTGGAIWLVQRKHGARTRLDVSAWGMPNASGATVRGVF